MPLLMVMDERVRCGGERGGQVPRACHAADWGLNYGEDEFWNLFCCEDNEHALLVDCGNIAGNGDCAEAETRQSGVWRDAGRRPGAQKFARRQEAVGGGGLRRPPAGSEVHLATLSLLRLGHGPVPRTAGLAAGDRRRLSIPLHRQRRLEASFSLPFS